MYKATSFDDLPDELLVRIFRRLLDDRKTLSSLRETCKRFLRIINYQLLKVSDQAIHKSTWTNGGSCVQCLRIFAVSNFKFVKLNHFVIDLPLGRCCLETFETVKSNLKTVTELTLKTIQFDILALSRLLATLDGVQRLKLDCYPDEKYVSSIESIDHTKLFKRELFHLDVNMTESKSVGAAELALLEIPSEEIVTDITSIQQATWVQFYILRYQEIVRSVNLFLDPKDRCTAEKLSDFMKSLGFNVTYNPAYPTRLRGLRNLDVGRLPQGESDTSAVAPKTSD
jgi:hypothetical protein